MENLNYPKMQYIINKLDATKLGYCVSTDPDTGATTNLLVLKKDGQTIPWISATANSIVVETSKPGANKSLLLKINAPAPCDLCHYEYGINVHVKYQQPAVMNDQYYPVTKSYGGVIDAIQTPSGGFMADSDIQKMEDTILTGIANDNKTVNVRELQIVGAKRLYIITTAAASTAIYNIYLPATGVTTAITANSGSTSLTQVNDINVNATVSGSVVAFAIDATHIAITSVAVGTLFTVADGGGATTIVPVRYMWIYALQADPKFYIDWVDNAFAWATVTPFNVLILNNLASAAGNSVLYVNSLSSGNIANSATSSTFAASILASNIGTGGTDPAYIYASATKTAGSVPVYVYSGANELRVHSLGTAGVSVTTQYSGKGLWPTLTYYDAFRAFMNAKGMDQLSNRIWLDQPTPGSLWNKIVLTVDSNSAALDGASHRDNYHTRVEIWVAQGYGSTAIWTTANYMLDTTDTGYTAQSSINALLAAWSGLTAGVNFNSVI